MTPTSTRPRALLLGSIALLLVTPATAQLPEPAPSPAPVPAPSPTPPPTAVALPPGAPPGIERIDAADLLAHATWLAADERGGRMTGSPGQEAAAQYIADHFAALGLEPFGD